MKLIEKLLIIQGAEFRVDKDGKNPHFKSSYVTLDNLLSVLLPLVTENKIVITHYMTDNKLITSVINTEMENDVIISEFPIHQEDPQKIGSAITYAKRYNLGSIFNIITEIDDDGNTASEKEKEITGEEHICRNCGKVNSNANVFEGKYGPCFKCTHCEKYSKPNPILNTNPPF